MDNATRILVHLQAAIELADTQEDHLIGAHLSVPMQILIERLASYKASGEAPTAPNSR